MKTLLIFAFVLVSCGRPREILVEKIGVDGYSIVSNSGILSPGTSCPNGGIVTAFYKDLNRDEEVTLGIDKLQTTFTICNGVNGAAGATGSQGLKGDTGASGTNGTNGTQGLKGDTGAQGIAGSSSVLQVIDLRHDVCGLPTKNFSEVILKLNNGTFLSSFSDNEHGENTRFTILVKNVTYITTDGNECRFKIDNSNNVVRI